MNKAICMGFHKYIFSLSLTIQDIGMASRASDQPMRTQESDDIMKTLLAHEKKASSTPAIIPGARVPVSDDSSSSDSESEFSFKPPTISIPSRFLTICKLSLYPHMLYWGYYGFRNGHLCVISTSSYVNVTFFSSLLKANGSR